MDEWIVWVIVAVVFAVGEIANMSFYLLPFAIGNVLGPIVLGHLFDSVGRKKMIAITYALAGLLLALTGWLFYAGFLTARTQTLAWSIEEGQVLPGHVERARWLWEA